MNEKEFLIKFLEFCYDKYNPLAKDYHPDYEQRLEESVSEFLRIHHMKYKAVYFYEWAGKERDIVREQVTKNLKDFLEYTLPILDPEKMEKTILAYVERSY